MPRHRSLRAHKRSSAVADTSKAKKCLNHKEILFWGKRARRQRFFSYLKYLPPFAYCLLMLHPGPREPPPHQCDKTPIYLPFAQASTLIHLLVSPKTKKRFFSEILPLPLLHINSHGSPPPLRLLDSICGKNSGKLFLFLSAAKPRPWNNTCYYYYYYYYYYLGPCF